MNRRSVGPRVALAAAGLLPALLVVLALGAGCGKPAQRTLHVYTWADYIKPEVVQRFEQENHCSIVIDTFDSNEAMYAKLKAGASGYDVLTPSSYYVAIMASQGMLLPLDHAKLPNLANVDTAYLKVALDPQMKVSVPYMLTNTGIAYLKSKVKDPQPTWAMLDRSDLKGRMTMLNDMRETVGAALKSLGFSLNTTSDQELDQARDVVIRWKKNLAKFESEQYKNGLASGEFLLAHGYSGDILQAQQENPDIAFLAPREGLSIACDDLVILKDSKAADLAHRFIDFLHDPGVAAENSQAISYLCPNMAAYAKMPAAFLDNPAVKLDPAVQAKCEVIRDLGPDNAKYTRVWDQIKAAP
jgi:spermidine/putrescine transport system substrate-binding protein